MQPITTKIFELEDTLKSWDEHYYQPLAQHYYDQAIPTMLKLMEVEPRATVLDAGCGPGVHSIRVAKEGYRVCAIDISQTMLEEAKKRVTTAGYSDVVEFQQQDLTNLSFPEAAFRYVFCWGVIIHIPQIEKALDQLARIVAPGGKLALYVTNKSAWDHKLESMLRFMLNKPLSGLERLPMGNGIWYDLHGEKLWVWQIDVEALTNYLENQGFRRTHRIIGEFTEIHWRVGSIFSNLLLRFNNLCYRLKLSPSPAIANLLVFEKVR